MTIDELQIQLDISSGNELKVLKQHTYETKYGYLFIDSLNGQCYLLDEHGKIDDIRKVKNIRDNTFYYRVSLKHIVIPDSVESIGHHAFENCTSLKSIMIPDSVKNIGTWAFEYCKSLKSIIIPDSVKSIGDYTFTGCKSLKEVIFKGKTMSQVKAMECYPWGINIAGVIKCQMS